MCIYIYVISLNFQFSPLQNHPDSGARKIKQDQLRVFQAIIPDLGLFTSMDMFLTMFH